MAGALELSVPQARNVSRLAEVVFGAEESPYLVSQLVQEVQDLVDLAVEAFNK